MQYMHLWSALSIAATTALLLSLRALWIRSKHYEMLNELACSFLWVSWRLEMLVVSQQLDQNLCLVVGFLLIFVQPYLYDTAIANPSSLLVSHLNGQVKWKRATSLLVCQLACLPIAIVYILAVWYLLAYFSPLHAEMPNIHTAPFLNVTPVTGFFLELVGTFVSFIPPMILTQPGVVQNAAVAGTFTALDFLMGHTTGAVFNPLPISASILLLRRHHVSELLLVYWAGALLGGALAWQLFMRRKFKSI